MSSRKRPLDYSPREFVVRLFPGVKPALLKGLFARVTRLELNDVGAVVDLGKKRGRESF